MSLVNGNGDRLAELAALRAVEPLDPASHRELERLLAGHPEFDPQGDELAAAALHLALLESPLEPLPSGLRAKLEADAQAFLAGAPTRASHRADRADRVDGVDPAPAAVPPHRILAGPWAGWLAAAAALVVALVLGLRPGGPRELAPGDLRAELLGEAGDVLKLAWAPTGHPASEGVSGEVVWSDARQEGVLSFRGLESNDPDRSQYQLWIIDRRRPGSAPVDGGVFDVPAGAAEVRVRVDAKLRVFDAGTFAVTLEPPGGVVVSSQEDLLLTASLE